MTLDEIKQRVKAIEALKGDDEPQHGDEDKLMGDFIAYVAETADDVLAEKAKAVMASWDLDFARWCA